MKIQLITVLMMSLFYNCSGQGTNENKKAGSTEQTSTYTGFLNDSTLLSRELFSIKLVDFYNEKKSDALPFEIRKMAYLLPVSLLVKEGEVYIPNNYFQRIERYSLSGEKRNFINYKCPKQIDLVKFWLNRSNDTLVILSNREGSYQFNDEKLFYNDPRTVNIFFNSTSDDILFKNEFNDRYAYLDKNKSFKSPITFPFYSVFFNNGVIRGIVFTENGFSGPFDVVSYDPLEGKEKERNTYNLNCEFCFYFPAFLTPDLLIASHSSKGDDLLYKLRGTELKKYTLKLDHGFEANGSLEYAKYIHSGLAHYYDTSSKKLYTMGTNDEYIKVFELDLSEILKKK